ncbi:MAG TPA: AMP-binding protein, partial [Burkholderiales bacterium]
MRVEAFLEESRRRHPDKLALVAGGARLSYADLDAAASRCANALRERGLARGDRVVVFMNNSAEAVVAIFGTLKAGGVFSVVNPGTKADKLAWLLDKYRATALVTEGRLLPVAAEAIPRAPSLVLALVAGAHDLPAGLVDWDAALAAAPETP